jgi:hypothetical protein
MTTEIKQSCPQGLTQVDLIELFPDEVDRGLFYKWMAGQTMSTCTGKEYHHFRYHDENCTKPSTFPGIEDPAHTEEDDYNWRCGYDGGYETYTVCMTNPHGTIVYRSDVERYLNGLPVID